MRFLAPPPERTDEARPPVTETVDPDGLIYFYQIHHQRVATNLFSQKDVVQPPILLEKSGIRRYR